MRISSSLAGGRISHYIESWRAEEPSHRCALALLFLLGVALRLAFLFQPIVQDEATTYVYFASQPLSTGLSHYTLPNNHLFHTLLVHLSTRMFGNNPSVIRLPALLAGILIMPLAYLVARRIFNKHAAVISLALTATSAYMVYYSVYARGYTIQTLIFLVLILTALNIMRADRLRPWVAFVALSALGFYTVPTMIYFFGALSLWMLLSVWYGDSVIKKSTFVGKLALSCLATALITALLYLPVFIASGFKALALNGHAIPLGWSRFVHKFLAMPGGLWKYWHWGFPLPVAIMVCGGFLASIVLYRRIARTRVNLALVVFAWFGVLIVAQRVMPFERTWLPFLPLYYGCSAAGLYYAWSYVRDAIRKKRAGRSRTGPSLTGAFLYVLVLWLGVSVLVFQSAFQPRSLAVISFKDAEKVATCLEGTLQRGDLVYLEPYPRKPLEYYFQKHGIPMEYLFGFCGKRPRFDSVKRAFVIDVKQGEFPVDNTLKWSDLGAARARLLRPYAEFDGSTVFVIDNTDRNLEANHSKR